LIKQGLTPALVSAAEQMAKLSEPKTAGTFQAPEFQPPAPDSQQEGAVEAKPHYPPSCPLLKTALQPTATQSRNIVLQTAAS
jgi:hypothetical protein